MISRFIEYKDSQIMVPLFKSMVRPILEYGNVIWFPVLKKHTQLIENVQRRFTKRVNGMSNVEYKDRLRVLKLPSLEFRRYRGDMIETYKVLHGLYDSNTTNNFFTLNQSATRGHPLKLIKNPVHTNLFGTFFCNRVVNLWNSLPKDVVLSGTTNSFKNSLDKYWAHHMYNTDLEL